MPLAFTVAVPPPVVETTVVTVVVVPSGSILLAVRSPEFVGTVSSSAIGPNASFP